MTAALLSLEMLSQHFCDFLAMANFLQILHHKSAMGTIAYAVIHVTLSYTHAKLTICVFMLLLITFYLSIGYHECGYKNYVTAQLSREQLNKKLVSSYPVHWLTDYMG